MTATPTPLVELADLAWCAYLAARAAGRPALANILWRITAALDSLAIGGAS